MKRKLGDRFHFELLKEEDRDLYKIVATDRDTYDVYEINADLVDSGAYEMLSTEADKVKFPLLFEVG